MARRRKPMLPSSRTVAVPEDRKEDDGVVNDSLGTVDQADSTGTDESKETGDAKKNNKPVRED